MLPAIPGGAPLERFLPEMAEDESGDVVLRRRAALASTLLAGLEMGREGAASLSQGQAFGEIVVVPAGRPESAHADPQAEVDLDRRPRARLATS
jgi:segregation and condensation protein A